MPSTDAVVVVGTASKGTSSLIIWGVFRPALAGAQLFLKKKKKELRDGESNPGLPRDRRGY